MMCLTSILQTIITTTFVMLMVTGGAQLHFLIFGYIFLFSEYQILTLITYGWNYFDRYSPEKGIRFSESVRRWCVWRFMAEYFPVRLMRTVPLSPNQKYLFILHPHGVLSLSHFINFCTEATKFSELFPGIRANLIALKAHFYQPYTREVIISAGMRISSEESLEFILNNGNSPALVVGGAREMMLSSPKTMTLYLKNREGFIRLALKHGVPLVPVISFGENDAFRGYSQAKWSRWIQNKIIDIVGIPMDLVLGRAYLPYIPFRNPITTIVGKPMEMEQISNPTAEQINHYRERYIQELSELYEKNKDKYNYKDVKLEII